MLCILTQTADEPLDGAAQAEPVKASPAARKLARELRVDLANVRGTGPNGRISEEDVRAAAKTSPEASESQDDGWTSLPGTRVALIELMRKSLAEIPQIHIQRQLDVTPLMQKTAGITFTHRLVLAAAAALKQHAALRTIINGTRVKVEPVSIAIAMDTPRGLLAPVVRNADQLSLEQIADAVRALQSKAESNSLTRTELANAPFAVSNLGMLGVDQFDAFVFHGQTAVLSVGRADQRNHAWFGLAADHRVVDGAAAARFLETLSREIGSK
jgi:pyruvate dehydrogenase E2 component (dihydrolipoamide acetyltransferase)